MAGGWAEGGAALRLSLDKSAVAAPGAPSEPGKLPTCRARTRKARLEAKKRPLTARTLLAALARPGSTKGDDETGSERRPARRPTRRAGDSVPLSSTTAAAAAGANSRDSSPAAASSPAPPPEALLRRLQKMERARLYLLEQPTPHSFLLATDSPAHQYRVTLGPQTCSCGRASLCVHLLFVMVKVLRLPASDPRLTGRTLKPHEIEALLVAFRRRRLPHVASLPSANSNTPTRSPSEERRCPVCQLEMTADDSVVRCQRGCQTRLHQRCWAVVAADASARHQEALCPLCRAVWPAGDARGGPGQPATPTVTSPSVTSPTVTSPSVVTSPSGVSTPSSPSGGAGSRTSGDSRASVDPSPSFHGAGGACSRHSSRSAAFISPSAAVFSQSSSCSRTPRSPCSPSSPGGEPLELGEGRPLPELVPRSPQLGRRAGTIRGSLRRATVRLERLESVERRQAWSQVLGRELVHLVFSRDWQIRDTGICRLAGELSHAVDSPGGRSAADLVHHVADLLAVLCADPVHKVFLGAINCVRVLLQRLTPCSVEETARLRCSLTPLVDALLLRSADANRRSAQLSAWTLSQLARGPAGQLVSVDLNGLSLVMDRLLQECRSGADSWQWCLGRLLVADHFVEQFPERFSGLSPDSACRVARLAEFAHGALTHPHATVSQLAHRVFVQMALSARAAPAAHAHIGGLLAALDVDVRLRLTRRIRGVDTSRPARRACPSTGVTSKPASVGSEEAGGGARRPRPTYLPLDGAAALKRRRSSLAPPARPERRARQKTEDTVNPEHVGLSNHHAEMEMEMEAVETPMGRYLAGAANPSVQDVIVHPHSTDMEGDTPTYTEELDWRRGPLLATGGFSTCYQACDLRSGRLMAVKQVQLSTDGGSDEAALLQEVRLLARLQHPHLLRLLGATQRPGLVSLFTEWEAGGSVAGLLELYGPFCADVIRRYTCHLVDGLAYLHDNHVLHRDLKGANLLVDSSGQTLRIGDLGTAACLGASSTLSGEFTGQLLGTVAFMAPEVLRGVHYGRSCDVWSVGCCIIEMATGRPPWDALTCSNHFALLFKIACSETPPPVPCHLPDDLRTLVSDCHRMDGEKRPVTRQLLEYDCFKGLVEQ